MRWKAWTVAVRGALARAPHCKLVAKIANIVRSAAVDQTLERVGIIDCKMTKLHAIALDDISARRLEGTVVYLGAGSDMLDEPAMPRFTGFGSDVSYPVEVML